jgi:phosphonate transport system permease protein
VRGTSDASADGGRAAIISRARAARRRRLAGLSAILLAVGACLWAVGLLDPSRLAKGVPALWQLGREMFPPDFSRARAWARPILDTLAMSVAGTAVAVALSLPLGLAAASNTTPHPAVYRLARLLLNALRSVPELIMGIFFVAAVGFGALPGALALGLHSAGMVGKFFAESIEHADPRPIEAARAAGATRLQIVTHAVIPQVFPRLLDTTLYRWEYNFRASTVLGVVGAGGIGFELIAALRMLEYRQVAATMICILVAVTLVDGLGGLVRTRLR